MPLKATFFSQNTHLIKIACEERVEPHLEFSPLYLLEHQAVTISQLMVSRIRSPPVKMHTMIVADTVEHVKLIIHLIHQNHRLIMHGEILPEVHWDILPHSQQITIQELMEHITIDQQGMFLPYQMPKFFGGTVGHRLDEGWVVGAQLAVQLFGLGECIGSLFVGRIHWNWVR
jgi:hypothetical protein